MSKTFIVVIEDAEGVYDTVDQFQTEVDTMVRAYVLPADVVAVYEVTDSLISTLVQGVGRKVSPTGSPAPSDFHDVAGANH